MNPAFKHHVEQLPADVRHLFLHKLRVCPVDEAWNVLFYARLTDTFSLADAVAYRESLALPAEPSPEPPPALPAPAEERCKNGRRSSTAFSALMRKSCDLIITE